MHLPALVLVALSLLALTCKTQAKSTLLDFDTVSLTNPVAVRSSEIVFLPGYKDNLDYPIGTEFSFVPDSFTNCDNPMLNFRMITKGFMHFEQVGFGPGGFNILVMNRVGTYKVCIKLSGAANYTINAGSARITINPPTISDALELDFGNDGSGPLAGAPTKLKIVGSFQQCDQVKFTQGSTTLVTTFTKADRGFSPITFPDTGSYVFALRPGYNKSDGSCEYFSNYPFKATSMKLDVYDSAPRAPSAITSSQTDTSITLSWGSVDGNATGTVVRMKGAEVFKHVSGKTVTFGGLSPSTQYTFVLYGVNPSGRSDPSPEQKVSTTSSLPRITSLQASSPTIGSGFRVGVKITIKFSVATAQPAVVTAANLRALFTFNDATFFTDGSNVFSGSWTDAQTLVISISTFVSGSIPELGLFTVTPKVNAIQAASGNVFAPAVRSPVLVGSFFGGTALVNIPSMFTVLENKLFSLSGVSFGSLPAISGTLSVNLGLIGSNGQFFIDVDGQALAFSNQTFTGSVTNLAKVLTALSFEPKKDFNGMVRAVLVLKLNGAALFTTTLLIYVKPVNNAPRISLASKTVSLPALPSTDAVLPAITIADADFTESPSTLFSVELGVSSGQLTYNATMSGVTVTSPGTVGPKLSFDCTMDVCNSFLHNVRYRTGFDDTTIFISVSDGGNGNPTRDGAAASASTSIRVSLTCDSNTPAPSLELIKLKSLRLLEVRFTREVVPVVSGVSVVNAIKLPCHYWFSDASSKALGYPSSCVVERRGLSVVLGNNHTVTADTTVLALRSPGTLRPCATSNNFVSGNATVRADDTNPFTSVSLLAPTQLSSCDDLVLRWRVASAIRLADLSLSWTAVPASILTGLVFSNTDTNITIASGNIPTGSFNISLVVGFRGVVVARDEARITKLSTNPPLASFTNAVVVRHRVNQRLVLRCAATAPSCFGALGDRVPVFQFVVSPQVAFRQSGGSFIVEANTLSAGKYVVACKTYYNDNPNLSSTTSTTVLTTPAAIHAQIRGGVSQSAALSSSVSFTAILQDESFAPITIIPGVTPTFTWSCVRSDGRPCLNATTSAPLTLPSTASFTLAASDIGTGTFKMSVSISVGSLVATDSQSIVIVPRLPAPVVRIIGPARIGPSSQLVLKFDTTGVPAVVVSSLLYSWSVPDGSLALTSTSSRELVVNRVRTDTVFVPGRLYSFRLRVSTTSGDSTQAEFAVRVADRPSGGFLSISPPGGVSLSTRFTLSTSGWSFDGSDLRFSFFFIDGTRKQFLTVDSDRASLSGVVLPASGSLVVGLTVRDNFGSEATVQKTIVVTSSGSPSLTNLITSFKLAAQQTGDPEAAAQGALAIIGQILSTGSTTSAVRQQIITDVVSTVLETLPPRLLVRLLNQAVNLPLGTSSALTTSTISTTLTAVKRFFNDTNTAVEADLSDFQALVDTLAKVLIDLKSSLPSKSTVSVTSAALQPVQSTQSYHDYMVFAAQFSTEQQQAQQAFNSFHDTMVSYAENNLQATGSQLFSSGDLAGQVSYSQANLIPNVNLNSVNVTFSTNNLVTVYPDTSAASVHTHVIRFTSNIYSSDVYVASLSRQVTGGLLSDAASVFIYDTTTTLALPAWNASANPVIIQLGLSASATACVAPSCAVACARWDDANGRWTTTGTVSRRLGSSALVACDATQAGTYTAFSVPGPDGDDSSEELYDDWRNWAAVGAVLVIVFFCCQCCYRYHKDEGAEGDGEKSMVVAIPGHENSSSNMEMKEMDRGRSGSLEDIDHDEVRKLARAWTAFFQSQHALNDGEQAPSQDEFIAEQLAAKHMSTDGTTSSGGY